MADAPRPGSIPAAAEALTACLAAVDRVIDQNDGHVAAGVDWHALRGSILRGRAALAAPKAEAPTRELAIATLIAYAEGRIDHSWIGNCPTGSLPSRRDPRCPVCSALKVLSAPPASPAPHG